jgi:hypothetical protein
MKIQENISADTSDRWVRKVVKYDYAAWPQKFINEEEINEHVIKGMCAVDEGKIDLHTLLS